jgi:hypothetical protein
MRVVGMSLATYAFCFFLLFAYGGFGGLQDGIILHIRGLRGKSENHSPTVFAFLAVWSLGCLLAKWGAPEI